MISFLILLLTFILSQSSLYMDPSAPISDRVKDLMDQMTLEEIVGQLQQVDGHFDFITPMKEQHPGSMFSLLGNTAAHVIDLARESRLKIPMLMGIDAIHGHAFWSGGTVFPTQLGSAQSWDEKLIEMQGNITASEIRYTGPSWTFSPVLCIARDTRWGRIGETFGEDPFLIGKFGLAMVKGLQGSLNGVSADPEKVAACAKHFVGYSETIGGRDSSESDLTFRKLQSFFLPPFERVAKEGKVATFMSGYQAIEGVPMTANRNLLTDLLKNKWGFEGFTVTDYSNIGYLISNQKIVENYVDASRIAVEAGNDMSMAVPDFYKAVLDNVNSSSKIDTKFLKFVNESCRRILELKFKLGLFEDDRYPDVKKAQSRNGSPFNRLQALKTAEESLILVKNENNFLPLIKNNINSIAIIGPNADNPLSQNGDWSLGTGQVDFFGKHPRNCTITYVDGIKSRVEEINKKTNKNITVKYEMGCGIEPGEKADLEAALTLVKESDISIVVVGDRLVYYGEMRSAGTLELMGGQKEMLQRIKELGKKFVLVVMSYKPVIIPEDVYKSAAAVILQFSPGMLGGKAFANAIFGDINPSGRLTISWPRHSGQLPVFYNKVRFAHQRDYADFTSRPMFSFGYGIGYSNISYLDAKLNKNNFILHKKDSSTKSNSNDDLIVYVTLKNDGVYDAAEVVQVYLHDNVTSATWPEIELKGFERVEIKAGETKTVEIRIPLEICSIVNAKGERVVEPGDFQARVGKASDNILFNLDFNIVD